MVPAFFVVTLIGFFFSASAPGDPVEIITGNTASQGTMQVSRSSSAIKDSVRHQLGLNLPLFYFSLGTSADPDDLYTIKSPAQRKAMKYLSRKYGSPGRVEKYFVAIQKHEDSIAVFDAPRKAKELAGILGNAGEPDTVIESEVKKLSIEAAVASVQTAQQLLRSLKESYQHESVDLLLDSLDKTYDASIVLMPFKDDAKKLKILFLELTVKPAESTNFIPSVEWNGAQNQYHCWLGNLFHGHFGYSYVDGQPVHTKIWEKFSRSFLLILLSVILAYLISIPAGVYSAKYKDRWLDKGFSWFSFILFSLPSYFVGTILLLVFANNSYFAWFPESGYCDPETYDASAGFFSRMWQQLPFMVLPIITYTYGSFAFISRLVRSSMLENLNADYIRTARAKGMSENAVLWKHALRNSYLPIITLFVNIFPAAIGGSVIVESIFSYPGMGLESVSAIHHADHPMLIS
ncbi:MAG: ABC transporter permease, partial [Flavobacteriales bacterium]